MKENLKTTRYKSGDPIPNVPDTTWPDIEYGAYAWYYNNVHWSYSYGALYNWYAVDDTNGLCPEGWKVPSNGGDFYSLKLYAESLSPNYGSSEVLKSCRQVNVFFGGLCNTTEHPRWDTDSQHYGFDLLGFSGMPGGLRFADGSFNQLGGYGYWWTSNPVTSAEDESYFWYMIFFTSQFSSYNYNNHSGFSVRCIKDD